MHTLNILYCLNRLRLALPLFLFAYGASAQTVGAAAKDGSQTATPPADAKMDEAKERYDRGIKLFDEGRFELAAIEFQRAYDLAPSYRILYNIGETQFQRGKYSEALRTLELYLKEGGSEIPGKRKLEVENDIDKLRTRTARISVTSNVPDADVLVDDIKIGKAPLQAYLIDAGSHRISIQKVGFRSTTEQVVLAGKDEKLLSLEMVAEGRDKVIIKEGGGGLPAYVWLSWAVTGALGIGTGVTGILASGAASDFQTYKDQGVIDETEFRSRENKKNTLATATYVVAGATAVSLGLSIVLTVVAINNKGDKDKKETPTAAWVTPLIGTGGIAGFSGGFSGKF